MNSHKRNVNISIAITILLLIVAISLIIYEIKSNEFNFFDYIPNIVTEVLSILLTVYLVEKAIEKTRKNKEKNLFFEICKNEFIILSRELSANIAGFITHGEFTFDENESENFIVQLEKYIMDIDAYIDKDFMRKEFKIHEAITLKEKYLDYFEYQKFYFRDPLSQIIGDFLHKYLIIIPDDIRRILFEIQNQLKADILANPLDFGLKLDPEKVDFNEKDFRVFIKKVGENAKTLIDYIQ